MATMMPSSPAVGGEAAALVDAVVAPPLLFDISELSIVDIVKKHDLFLVKLAVPFLSEAAVQLVINVLEAGLLCTCFCLCYLESDEHLLDLSVSLC